MDPIWRPLWGELAAHSDEVYRTPDVIVVGAGIAGCTAAVELQRSGQHVLLLEARTPGAGTTGRTTAKVTAGHAAIYADLVERHGVEAATAYSRAQTEALAYFQARAHVKGVEEVTHHVFWETDDGQAATEFAASRSVGLDTELDASSLPGSTMALNYQNQYQIDPTAWLRSLLSEFHALGGQLVSDCRVLEIDDGDKARVRTRTQTYEAQDVIVATHFPISHPVLGAPRLSTQMALVVAGPSTMNISGTWISADDSLSIRTADDSGERILVISGEPYRNGEGDSSASYHRLGALAQKRFGLKELRYFWSAHDLHTEDRLPYIGLQLPTSHHVWVASGFGSWGMTNGTFAGLMLRDLITIGTHPARSLFDPRRIGFVPPASQAIRESGEAIKHLIGGRVSHAASTSVDDLTPGQGRVIREGRNFVAAHRTTSGELIKVAAACTHLGCLVSWNSGDQTWDCPCHGSRFQSTGEVIEGPAVDPLERVE